jgi:RNA polymerase sigma-70 factor (ECF subfamily)
VQTKIDNYFIDDVLQVEALMNDYTNYILTIIRKFSFNLSEEDIEEIMLDVFLTIWNNQEKLIRDCNMSPYIAGITKNLIRKKYRKLKVVENIQDYDEKLVSLENIELIFSQNEKNRAVLEEVNKMKSDDKEIFIAYYYDEKRVKEISIMLNISESKVKSRLFRIRKKLKKVLKEREV